MDTHNEITWWRLDELAERAGIRTWSVLVAPPEPGPDHEHEQRRLHHALRSAQVAGFPLPAFWRRSDRDVALSSVFVMNDIAPPQSVKLARRYGLCCVLVIQRIPFEQVVVHNVTAEQRVEVPRFEPAALADRLARMAGVEAVVMMYRWTTIGEAIAIAMAERRLRGR